MKINLSKRERTVLIRGAVLLVVLFALFKGVEYGDETFAADQQAQNSTLRTERDSLTERLGAISDEERLQQQYADSYQGFADRGVIGDEKRLNWIEKMQEITSSRRLYQIEYQIGNQERHLPEAFAFTENSTIQVKSTTMHFNLGMLHDIDFLMFLEDYAANVDGIFIPLRCSMSPTSEEEAFVVELRQNFMADCDIEWITVSDPDQGKGRGETG